MIPYIHCNTPPINSNRAANKAEVLKKTAKLVPKTATRYNFQRQFNAFRCDRVAKSRLEHKLAARSRQPRAVVGLVPI